ncbi:TolC family protein [uncultured Alistipes sp.]|uniref:TolC family protein n=1 Tax=uncultured Alistipes sp. TaxID=538949 RepID=UPI0034448ECA
MREASIRQAEYALSATWERVNKEATQALICVHIALNKYLSSQKYVFSAAEVVRQMECKYNLGVTTSCDYNTVIDVLVQAQKSASTSQIHICL